MKKILALTAVSAGLVATLSGVASAAEVSPIQDYFIWQQLTGN